MATNSISSNAASHNGVSQNGTSMPMELCLHITDSDLCDELSGYQEGTERDNFALSALKIGVTALRQAQGRIDAEQIHQAGDTIIQKMAHALDQHQRDVTDKIGDFLKDYFDPESGRFNERVQRLVGNDGELERVIRPLIEGDGSHLAQTLIAHVGKDSPLMQTLDPDSASGLIAQLTQSTEDTLTTQSERILSEFSQDNKDSAINRLIAQLKDNHGEVGRALEERISEVVSEFSLDKKDSALTRLMNGVEQAQRQINSEFDLNQEGSALARMRKELLDSIETQRQTNEQFQRDVIEKLAEMTARKQEAQKSTRHGIEFESAVFNFINEQSQNAGDIATHTGNTTGRIKNNKKGDVVIVLGPESAAAGARVVVEAKEDASFNLTKALEELEIARKNRDADIGLFVFSKTTAPEGLDVFNRYGNDIVTIWDKDDTASDIFLNVGLSVSKALSLRSKSHSKETGADFEAIEKAIIEIERQAGGLDEIKTSAETIRNSSDKILNRARIMREGLDKQIGILNNKVDNLREAVGSAA